MSPKQILLFTGVTERGTKMRRVDGHQQWEFTRNSCHFSFPPLLGREVKTRSLFAILKKRCAYFDKLSLPSPSGAPLPFLPG